MKDQIGQQVQKNYLRLKKNLEAYIAVLMDKLDPSNKRDSKVITDFREYMKVEKRWKDRKANDNPSPEDLGHMLELRSQLQINLTNSQDKGLRIVINDTITDLDQLIQSLTPLASRNIPGSFVFSLAPQIFTPLKQPYKSPTFGTQVFSKPQTPIGQNQDLGNTPGIDMILPSQETRLNAISGRFSELNSAISWESMLTPAKINKAETLELEGFILNYDGGPAQVQEVLIEIRNACPISVVSTTSYQAVIRKLIPIFEARLSELKSQPQSPTGLEASPATSETSETTPPVEAPIIITQREKYDYLRRLPVSANAKLANTILTSISKEGTGADKKKVIEPNLKPEIMRSIDFLIEMSDNLPDRKAALLNLLYKHADQELTPADIIYYIKYRDSKLGKKAPDDFNAVFELGKTSVMPSSLLALKDNLDTKDATSFAEQPQLIAFLRLAVNTSQGNQKIAFESLSQNQVVYNAVDTQKLITDTQGDPIGRLNGLLILLGFTSSKANRIKKALLAEQENVFELNDITFRTGEGKVQAGRLESVKKFGEIVGTGIAGLAAAALIAVVGDNLINRPISTNLFKVTAHAVAGKPGNFVLPEGVRWDSTKDTGPDSWTELHARPTMEGDRHKLAGYYLEGGRLEMLEDHLKRLVSEKILPAGHNIKVETSNGEQSLFFTGSGQTMLEILAYEKNSLPKGVSSSPEKTKGTTGSPKDTSVLAGQAVTRAESNLNLVRLGTGGLVGYSAALGGLLWKLKQRKQKKVALQQKNKFYNT